MASVGKIKLPGGNTQYDLRQEAVLTGTLVAGNTTLSFTNAAITSTATFDVYTEDCYIPLTDIARENTTLTLTFPEQSSNVNVKVVIKEW